MISIIRKQIRKIFQAYSRFKIRHVSFVIIADNCWGAEIYKDLNRPYNTPFVGLFLHSPCFLRLLENFTFYMEQPLEFVFHSRYPIAKLDYPIAVLGNDVEIHFLHYKDENEAAEKWNRRLARMKKNSEWGNYYFKISAEGVDDNQVLKLLDRFYALPFKNKISFALSTYKSENHFFLPDNKMPDGLSLYGVSCRLFDVKNWLGTGKIKKTFWNSLIARI